MYNGFQLKLQCGNNPFIFAPHQKKTKNKTSRVGVLLFKDVTITVAGGVSRGDLQFMALTIDGSHSYSLADQVSQIFKLDQL